MSKMHACQIPTVDLFAMSCAIVNCGIIFALLVPTLLVHCPFRLRRRDVVTDPSNPFRISCALPLELVSFELALPVES